MKKEIDMLQDIEENKCTLKYFIKEEEESGQDLSMFDIAMDMSHIQDKNDKDVMSTVSSSSNEQGYFSSSSEDLEPVQQEVQNNVLKSNKNMIAVMKRYILPEHPQENKIIKI